VRVATKKHRQYGNFVGEEWLVEEGSWCLWNVFTYKFYH
jgi:hypothetical protein